MLNRAGIPYQYRVTMQVEGEIGDDGPAALTTQENALKAALKFNFKDLIFYQDDAGTTPTGTALINAQTISGVMIVDGPNFMNKHGPGPEYVTLRTFNFTAQADFPAPNSGALFIDYQETLTTSGGLPFYMVKAAVSGPNQRQLIYPQEPYKAVQSGHIVGYRTWPPIIPAPLFPGFLKQAPRIQKGPVERTGILYRNFTVSYEYQFESGQSPLVDFPSLWPLSH